MEFDNTTIMSAVASFLIFLWGVAFGFILARHALASEERKVK